VETWANGAIYSRNTLWAGCSYLKDSVLIRVAVKSLTTLPHLSPPFKSAVTARRGTPSRPPQELHRVFAKIFGIKASEINKALLIRTAENISDLMWALLNTETERFGKYAKNRISGPLQRPRSVLRTT
jgi:hypothetical protein